MRHWRKTTWAIVIWTAFFAIWLFGGISAAAPGASQSEAYAAGAAIGGTIIFVFWLFGLVPLALLWFGTRPKSNVLVYGPGGQQVIVSEKEARQRVEKGGWSYRPS